MHELSIIMNIIEIAEEEAGKAKANSVKEINLEIGCLSTIEPYAFDFAWKQAINQTMLANAALNIDWVKGRGQCNICHTQFATEELYSTCNNCSSASISLVRGKELRIKSLVVT